ncbi:MAG: folate family ECF transporter S component [Tissierellia bacterium]|nr:folate family ECF transporter S component [Tissierellia bacterium]
MRKLNAKNIAYYALLIALNVVLTRVGSIRIGGGGTELVRIGFGGFPIIFAGIVFGPVAGAIVGAVGDIIGMIVSPMGPYMPHFTLNAALTGVIPGLIMMRCKDKGCKTSFVNLLVAIAVGQVTTSIVLWAYFMKTLFGIPLVTILPGRIISQLVNIPLYAYMIKVILSRLPLAIDTK